MVSKHEPASCGVSLVERSDVVGMFQEMIDRLLKDFGFGDVKLVGEAHLNRTTEPVARFLLWVERTPEAQAALRLALQRLVAERARAGFEPPRRPASEPRRGPCGC
jgi:hypothetical protein